LLHGLDIEQFSREFESFLGLTPLSRIAFLEILHNVDDKDWSGTFACGEFQALCDIALRGYGSEAANSYIELVRRIMSRIIEKQEKIIDMCNKHNAYYDIEDISFFMSADEIAQYIRVQAFKGSESELPSIFEYLYTLES
jgi:hypothetical protein